MDQIIRYISRYPNALAAQGGVRHKLHGAADVAVEHAEGLEERRDGVCSGGPVEDREEHRIEVRSVQVQGGDVIPQHSERVVRSVFRVVFDPAVEAEGVGALLDNLRPVDRP